MVKLRLAKIEDLEQILNLFSGTVTHVNSRDYTPKQLNAWKVSSTDKIRWQTKITDQYFLITENGVEITGFSSITDEGYLDTMFVHKDHQGKGIASLLMRSIVEYAENQQFSEITTEASITARPFFEKFGFEIVEEQLVNRKGVQIKNFKMLKVLK